MSLDLDIDLAVPHVVVDNAVGGHLAVEQHEVSLKPNLNKKISWGVGHIAQSQQSNLAARTRGGDDNDINFAVDETSVE